ncbi:MAG: hypothetical protein HY875_01240 [Chloroflexi bacterium]|nr:hypothetical protein [Chloroflexota bacterium]
MAFNRLRQAFGARTLDKSSPELAKREADLDGDGAAAGGGGSPAEGTINNSKSNTFRAGAPAGDAEADSPAAEEGSGPSAIAANLNSSRSNIYRTAGPDGGGSPDDPAARATNLNSSKSNIYRTAGPDGGESPDDPAARAINLNSSKSNVYRASGPGDDGDSPGGPAAMTSNLNLSKSNIDRVASGGEGGSSGLPGGESALATSVKSSKSNSQDRLGGGDNDQPDGADDGMETGRISTNTTIERQTPNRDFGDRIATKEPSKVEVPNRMADSGDDGAPDAAEGTIVKSKSNITNNREAQDSGDDGGGGGGGGGMAAAKAAPEKPPRDLKDQRVADPGQEDSPEAAINNTKSNIKNVTADPDGDAGGPEATFATTVKSSKSNSSERLGGGDDAEGGGAGMAAAKAAPERPPRDLKDQRMADPGQDDSPEAAINNTKSNIKNVTADPDGDPGGPEAPFATTVKGSKSNTSERTAGGGDADDGPPEAAINTSHSNIKNLRTAGPDSDGDGIAVGDAPPAGAALGHEVTHTVQQARQGVATGAGAAAGAARVFPETNNVDDAPDLEAAGLAAGKQKQWLPANFRESAAPDDDDDGPSTLLDLSAVDEPGAVAITGDPDFDLAAVTGDLDLDADSDADDFDVQGALEP